MAGRFAFTWCAFRIPGITVLTSGLDRMNARASLDSAGRGALVEWDAGDHGHLQIAAYREQPVLGGLVEDVVDHLDGIDQTGAQRPDPVFGFPAVQTETRRLDKSLALDVIDPALPALGPVPTVVPDVELDQVDLWEAEVLETGFRKAPDVIAGKDVTQAET